MSEYTLRIITPSKVIFEDTVESIIAPGGAGYLGVLAHHAPLATTIKPGRLTVRRKNEEISFDIGEGLLEVLHNQVSVLVDFAKRIE
ncbi:ATP synthase F1 subunit epsilon [Candidatus Sumerlaeota bacterium]|nr:ATP synthase F1 subunit epsilon [Candidatus Sumerlaeota bacterium]